MNRVLIDRCKVSITCLRVTSRKLEKLYEPLLMTFIR